MFCTNCGKEIKEGTFYCPDCGEKIKKPDKSAIEISAPIIEENSPEVASTQNTALLSEKSTKSDNSIEDTEKYKNDKSNPNKFQFIKNVWEFKSITDIELQENMLCIERGIHLFKDIKILKKTWHIYLQDIANVSVKKRIPIFTFLLGMFFLSFAVVSGLETGIDLKTIIFAVIGIGGICTRYFALLIFDRNNRMITIMTESEKQSECDRFINTINKKMDEYKIPKYNPATFKQPFYHSNAFRIAVICLVAVVTVSIASVSLVGDQYVGQVKSSYWEAYPDATIEEILDFSIKDIRWQSFDTAGNRHVVQIEGYLDNGKEVVFQFLAEDDGGIEIYATRVDGEIYSDELQSLFFMVLIANYDNALGDGTFEQRMNAKFEDAYNTYISDAILESIYW